MSSYTLDPSGNAESVDVFYKNAMMPRPLLGQQQDVNLNPLVTSSDPAQLTEHVSWEEVFLAQPATTTENSAAVALSPRSRVKDLAIISLAMSGAATFFGLLVKASGPGAWRYYLAGGLCAAISHALPVPIDVVKTRKQVDPALQDKDFLSAMRHMVKSEGPRSLLAGLGPTTVGYLIEGAIKFGVYEATKPFIRRMLVTVAGLSSSLAFLNSHILALCLCGATSGIAASIALCPMEALRIRLVAQKETESWVKVGFNMIRNEGIGSLTRGMMPMFYKQVPYTVTKNASFDVTTRAAYASLRTQGLPISPSMKVAIPVLSAALASILSCISSQPGDMLLSLMNANEGERRRTRDIVRDILRSDRGISGFFVGIKTRFLHVGIIVTLQLFLYDVIKRLCGIAATGSV